MNGYQNDKSHHHDKPSPGCLGRVVNLFDLNAGMARNRLLTDKPHRDGPLLRSQSDVVRLSLSEDHVEDKLVFSNMKRTSSNQKSNGTPMKTLIAQEMSKEVYSSHNPPSVVAKLMGLDALPTQKSVPAIRSHFGGHSRCHTDSSFSYCQHEDKSLVEEMRHKCHQYTEQNQYKDVYEVWPHSPKMNSMRSKSPHKARDEETGFDKKSAFVRQKFIEAKCLSIDEQLRQSKEFQDALDVLSSNTDLFLKFLQEPNPMFSQNLYNLPSLPPPPETKRITVLRPSKMADDCKFGGSVKKSEKEIKRANHAGQGNRAAKNHMAFSSPAASWNVDENHGQPTRIIVLKPTVGKTQNFRAASSSPFASPRVSQAERSSVNLEFNEAQESREVAKAITQQMRENISGNQGDETLISAFSNGYIGDESSFNKSEKEYAAGIVSDSEIMSPASRHSWEYINRFGSPCSSYSRASYSPESSVSREAKKRLSERWAMVESNGSRPVQRQMKRSSSTLGEMLALSDIKSTERTAQESIKEDPRISNSTSAINSKDDEGVNESPRNLLRSKSVPVSSTALGVQLNVRVPDPVIGENDLTKQTTKPRSTKSSLKGKVSNLFFSRNKKPTKDGAKYSQSNGELQSDAKPLHPLSKVDKYSNEFLDERGVECSATDPRESSGRLTCEDLFGKQGTASPEVALSGAKSLRAGHPCESQDQPSPVSVLETPFEEDEHPACISSGGIKLDHLGNELSLHPIKSNLIDKSPPIGSISRTLSWDDCCADTASSVYARPSSTQQTEEVEREWLSFVQTLLTVAGLDEVHADVFSTMWYSPESPLDPSVREKYIDLNEKETLHEAKRRQRRSMQKLVFDCVNATLIEIAGNGPDYCERAIPYVGVHDNQPQGAARLLLVDQVWDRMKEWFSSEVKYFSSDGGDLNSLVVEGLVGKEVMGKWWLDDLRLQLDNIGMEIEGKLLEELVHESVIELAGKLP